MGVSALIVALPWRWGQRRPNIAAEWSHERGGAVLQYNNMDSILISGSLGCLCKAVQHKCGETWGGGGVLSCSRSLLYPERLRGVVMEVGRGGQGKCGGVAGKVEGCTL